MSEYLLKLASTKRPATMREIETNLWKVDGGSQSG